MLLAKYKSVFYLWARSVQSQYEDSIFVMEVELLKAISPHD